jgi:hypothetical protein
MKPANKTRAVMSLIADKGPIAGSVVARMVGQTEKEVHSAISKAHKAGRISRNKPKDSGYFRYFMTEQQRARFLSMSFGTFQSETLDVDIVDVPARLRFLERLQKTVHHENPILQAIIDDYRRTLKHLQAREN